MEEKGGRKENRTPIIFWQEKGKQDTHNFLEHGKEKQDTHNFLERGKIRKKKRTPKQKKDKNKKRTPTFSS